MLVPEGVGRLQKGGYQNWASANKGEGVHVLIILWDCNNWMNPFGLVWLAKKVWIASFPDGAKAIDWNVAVLN